MNRVFTLSFLLFKQVSGILYLDPLVETKAGFIRGMTANDGDYFMFLGVPYAKVDQDKPFGAAIKQPPFEKIFDADNDSKMCPQSIQDEKNETIGIGTLDCLTLSIFAPYSVLHGNDLPVLVWLHGGKFLYGSSSTWLYSPKYLMQHNLIVVFVNYRISIYGFMCLNTADVPGNQGLKDQVLALRWIKEHISRFGGDVNAITVMGESAGAKSIDLHLHSNNEKLFHRCIMQGGSAYTMPPDLRRDDGNLLLQLANELGLKTKNIQKALQFVQGIDEKIVIVASDKSFRFIPCVEHTFDGVESFISENPINLDLPKVKDASVLIGYNSNDQFIRYVNKDKEIYETWDGFLRDLSLYFNFDKIQLETMSEIVNKFYIKHKKVTYDERFKVVDFTSDLNMMHPTQRTINKYIDNGARGVYQYIFSYVGDRNFVSRIENDTNIGAVHADELGYLFRLPYIEDEDTATTPTTPEDQLIIERMTTMWTNFAKYGDPTPDVSQLLPVVWQPITKEDSTLYYLNINTTMNLDTYPYHARMAFWDLFFIINEKYLRGLQNVSSINH